MAESQCIAQASRLDGGSVALTGRHAIACDESMCGIADRHRAGRCGAEAGVAWAVALAWRAGALGVADVRLKNAVRLKMPRV